MTRKEAVALGRARRIAKLRDTATERFWAKVQKGAPDECWEWRASRMPGPRPYGRHSWNGQTMYAHRIALSLTDGDWSNERFVCHSCDNPPCCNPFHLWRGSQRDNLQDMSNKGRNSISGNAGRPGETNGRSKLTTKQVQEIRSSSLSDKKLAAIYGVAHGHIFRIRSRLAWSHVE